jgi:predicted DCC family thiol-disulfide oxidoreductase YuxK
VRWLLAEDVGGTRFRFAPLQGATFEARVDASVRSSLPDSVVVRTADGRLFMRSSAIAYSLTRLGGLWRVAGALMFAVPQPLRDFVYDRIARVRRTVFAAPKELCPLLPPHLAARFEP